MESSRPVRIRRRPDEPRGLGAAGALVEHRPNPAGSQRAFRFAFLYLGALLVVDAILVALDLSSAEAGRPGVQADLQLFLGVAILLAVGSVVYALSPAPRFVEVRTEGVIVLGRWGRRAWLPPIDRLQAKVVRHWGPGLLSSAPVDLVQVVDRNGKTRTYQVDSGLFAPSGGAS